MHLCLSFYIYLNSRFQFNDTVVIPDDNLLKPPPCKALIKLGKLGILLLYELVQLIDTLDLFVTDGGVGEVLLFHLTKSEYLIGDVVVTSYVVFSFNPDVGCFSLT
jgi:hypothetical protein